jgi:hypothetical protein
VKVLRDDPHALLRRAQLRDEILHDMYTLYTQCYRSSHRYLLTENQFKNEVPECRAFGTDLSTSNSCFFTEDLNPLHNSISRCFEDREKSLAWVLSYPIEDVRRAGRIIRCWNTRGEFMDEPEARVHECISGGCSEQCAGEPTNDCLYVNPKASLLLLKFDESLELILRRRIWRHSFTWIGLSRSTALESSLKS